MFELEIGIALGVHYRERKLFESAPTGLLGPGCLQKSVSFSVTWVRRLQQHATSNWAGWNLPRLATTASPRAADAAGKIRVKGGVQFRVGTGRCRGSRLWN